MGILSFLQKKGGDKSKVAPTTPAAHRAGELNGSLKSQAYDAALPGALPVIGAYPVAGNGPSVLQSLSRAGSRLNETQISLETASIIERAAPSPAVPRYRDDGYERPSTAPHGSQSTTNWAAASARLRKNSLRGAHPPISLRNARNESLLSGSALPEIGTASFTEPPIVPPNAPFTHVRSNSIRSNSDKTFKDILDAQAEIHPADFKTRVQAAGARDYGEDVADRNIGMNGVDLESPQVQAFYASSTTGSASGYSSQLVTARPWRREESLSRPGSKQSSYESSSQRTKSLNSTAHYSFPKRTTSHIPQPPIVELPPEDPPMNKTVNSTMVEVKVPTTAKSIRRQSLHTYMPTGSNGTDNHSRSRPASSLRNAHAHDIPHYVAMNNDTDAISSTAPSPDLRSAASGSPRIGMGIISRHGSGLRPQSPKAPRDSMMLPRKTSRAPHGDYITDDGVSELYTPSTMSFSHHRPSSYSQRGSVTSSASHRQSGHTFHSSISSSIASHDTAVDFTPLAYPTNRPRTVREEYRRAHGRFAGVDAVDLDVSSGNFAGVSSHYGRTSGEFDEYRGGRGRSHSITSTIGKGRYDDGPDQVPMRTSSFRHWSISSASPSNASSNSLPHSRHTAETSLDLNNAYSIKSSSRTSLSTTIANSPQMAKSSAFNIDDYISSDDDDFMTPRPRGEGEEDLLFNDSGYGVEGSFLPGLGTGLSSPTFPSQQARSVSSMPSETMRNAYSSPLHTGGAFSPRHTKQRRYVIDTAADSDSDAGESDTESWYDARELRFVQDAAQTQPLRNARGTKRLSAIGTLYGHQYNVSDVIEEERLEKIDAAAAVKLRKEVKTRKREAQMAKRRMKIKEKQPQKASVA